MHLFESHFGNLLMKISDLIWFVETYINWIFGMVSAKPEISIGGCEIFV